MIFLKRIKFIFPIIILIITVSLNELLLYSVEMKARAEARSNITAVITSLPQLESHNLSTKESLDIIARNVRTFGETGDMHSYNVVHLVDWDKSIIFFDASQDCTTEKALNLGEVVRMFSRPDTAEKAFKYILNSRKSSENTRLSWQFDDVPEWLEWQTYDDPNMGPIVIVAGVQSDEAMDGFRSLSIFMQISGFIALVLIMLLNIQIARKER
jgi:hypothetical protein